MAVDRHRRDRRASSATSRSAEVPVRLRRLARRRRRAPRRRLIGSLLLGLFADAAVNPAGKRRRVLRRRLEPVRRAGARGRGRRSRSRSSSPRSSAYGAARSCCPGASASSEEDEADRPRPHAALRDRLLARAGLTDHGHRHAAGWELMKLIVGIIKPFKLDDVKDALQGARRPGTHGVRRAGLRPPARPHRGVPRRRVHGRLRAEGARRDPRRRRRRRPGRRSSSSRPRAPARSATARCGSSRSRPRTASAPASRGPTRCERRADGLAVSVRAARRARRARRRPVAARARRSGARSPTCSTTRSSSRRRRSTGRDRWALRRARVVRAPRAVPGLRRRRDAPARAAAGAARSLADDASQLWYPLWDAGFVLGHSVRTVKEALVARRRRPRRAHRAARRAPRRRRRRARRRARRRRCASSRRGAGRGSSETLASAARRPVRAARARSPRCSRPT